MKNAGKQISRIDYDNDGNLDLVLANGHPDDMVAEYSANVGYDEPMLLFHNDGRNRTNVSADAGHAFEHYWNARVCLWVITIITATRSCYATIMAHGIMGSN